MNKSILDIAKKYAVHCDRSKIICTSTWRSGMASDATGLPYPGLSRGPRRVKTEDDRVVPVTEESF